MQGRGIPKGDTRAATGVKDIKGSPKVPSSSSGPLPLRSAVAFDDAWQGVVNTDIDFPGLWPRQILKGATSISDDDKLGVSVAQ